MTFTLIVFLLTVLLGPTGAPASIARSAQQTPGYATVEACEADAAAKRVAAIPGAVFWMCMGTGSGADQWLVQNWLRTPTAELPLLKSAAAATATPTWFMLLTLAYPAPVSVRMGGFPSLDACDAVRRQLNFAPVDPIQFTLSACQETTSEPAPLPAPVITAGGKDVLVWTTCPPRRVSGYLRVSSCVPECDPGYTNTVPMTRTSPCPTLLP